VVLIGDWRCKFKREYHENKVGEGPKRRETEPVKGIKTNQSPAKGKKSAYGENLPKF
jgi:hypothetical protein